MGGIEGGTVAGGEGEQRGGAFARNSDQSVIPGEFRSFRVEEHRVLGSVAELHVAAAEQSGDGARRHCPSAGKLSFDAKGGGVDSKNAGQFGGDAIEGVGGAHQRQDGFLHSTGQARSSAAGGKNPIGPLGHRRGIGSRRADHGGHMIGENITVHPNGRGEDPVKLGILGKPAGIGAEKGSDLRRLLD